MARQEDVCWRCGAQWASEDDEPRTRLAVIPGGAAGAARASTEAALDAERWVSEGGAFAAKVARAVGGLSPT